MTKKINHTARISQIVAVFAAGWIIGFYLHRRGILTDGQAGILFVVPGMIISGLMLVWYLFQIIKPIAEEKSKQMKKEKLENELLRYKQLAKEGIISNDEYEAKLAEYQDSENEKNITMSFDTIKCGYGK
jgi:type III secretory pathway component EscR